MAPHQDASEASDLVSTSGKAARKKRKDAGQPRWEQRDYHCLEWMGFQTTVRFDQLQRLLGRESPQWSDYAHTLAPSSAANAVTRWEHEKLVNSRHFFAKEAKYYWLSQRGLDFVELKLPHQLPEASLVKQYYACNQIRLYLEQLRYEGEYGKGAFWVSSRELRNERQETLVPDGEWHDEEGITAILVVLHHEEPERTLALMSRVLKGQMGEYTRLWCFFTQSTKVFLERMRATLRQSGTKVDKLSLCNGEDIITTPSAPKRSRKPKRA